MVPVAFLQNLTLPISPQELTAWMLLLAALVTLVCGFAQRGRGFVPFLPSVLYVLFGSLCFLTPPPGSYVALGLCGLLLAATLFLSRTPEDGSEPRKDPEAPPQKFAWIPLAYLLTTLLLVVWGLFHNLDGSTLRGWEETNVRTYFKILQEDREGLSNLGEHFLWSVGAMNSSPDSLFYGLLTGWLLRITHYSLWPFRLIACVLTLSTIPLVFYIGKRFWGAVAGVAGAALLGLNVLVLYYGRYAGCLSGTLPAVLVALLATGVFLENKRAPWWAALVWGLALYVATLQYAVGRLVVLILIGVVLLALICQHRNFGKRRVIGLSVAAVFACALVALQYSAGATRMFLHGNREHILHYYRSSSLIEKEIGHSISPEELTLADKGAIARRMIGYNLPQLAWLMSPAKEIQLKHDPPKAPMYYAPLFPFLLWGFLYALLRPRSWMHVSLLAWLVLLPIPLLMTNILFVWRLFLIVVPLTFFGAIGLREAARVLREARVPVGVQHLFAGLLLAGLVFHNTQALSYFSDTPPHSLVKAVIEEADTGEGPVTYILDAHPSEWGWLAVQLLERMRMNPEQRENFIKEPPFVRTLRERRSGETQILEASLKRLERILDGNETLILAPAGRFATLGATLEKDGYPLSTHERQGTSVLKVQPKQPGADNTRFAE